MDRQIHANRNVACPRAIVLQALAGEVRTRTLQLLRSTPASRLLWTPLGTSNHILWHGGHSLWVQDALCVQLLTGRSELPDGWEQMFRMGSRPAFQRDWPTRDELRQRLTDQLSRLVELIGSIADMDLDILPRFAHRGDTRTLGECVLHGLHDEANHQGEMYLLFKIQQANPAAK